MLTLPSILLLGFFLGMRHATDPDHVLAVSTIVGRERSVAFAAVIGSLWGIGHTLTLLFVGGAITAFGLVVPARWGSGMELVVAAMLVVLGVGSLARTFRRESPEPRRADDHAHAGECASSASGLHRFVARFGLLRALRPIAIGTVHGLAGSAGVWLLLVPTIRNPAWAVGYLLIFGLGTIAGMLLLTAALAVPFVYAARRAALMSRVLCVAAGLSSLAFGAFMAWRIVAVSGYGPG